MTDSPEAQTQHDTQAERDAKAISVIDLLQDIPSIKLSRVLHEVFKPMPGEVDRWIDMWIERK